MPDDILEEIDLSAGKDKPGEVKVETAKPETRRSVLRPERDSDPAVAAREAAKKVQDAQNAVVAERERANRAEAAVADANGKLATAGKTLFAERSRAVDQGLDQAKATKASATAALRAARETGDFEAETVALDQIANANYSISKLTDEKGFIASEVERMKAEPAAAARQNADPARAPAAQAWISAHPLYHTDKVYQARCNAADAYAVAMGTVRGTQAYFDTIDQELAKEFGAGHGVSETHGKSQRREDRQTSGGAVAMRPGGTTDAHGSQPGERTLDTELGPIQIARNFEGKPVVRMSSEMRKDFSEAARWNNMTLAEYTQAQIEIAEERLSGRPSGVQRNEDTVVYR